MSSGSDGCEVCGSTTNTLNDKGKCVDLSRCDRSRQARYPSKDQPKSVGEILKPKEQVDHPAHYGGDTVYEVIKVCEAWGLVKDAYLFNAVKYIARSDKKEDALADLKKARWYLDRKIQRMEAEKKA